MVAIIGGEFRRFRPLVDLYRETGMRSGYSLDRLKVGVHALGYVAATSREAADDFFPGYARAFTTVGKERGWPPVTRAQFDAQLKPDGALGPTHHRAVSSRRDRLPGGGAAKGGPARERHRIAFGRRSKLVIPVLRGRGVTHFAGGCQLGADRSANADRSASSVRPIHLTEKHVAMAWRLPSFVARKRPVASSVLIVPGRRP